MSKFEQAIETYKKSLTDKLGRTDFNEDLLRAIAKSLGPSIYNADSAKVACSSKSELENIKASFLIKKLNLKEGSELDAAIKDVCKQMGSSNRSKYRAVFYYLLVERFGKESIYIKKVKTKKEGIKKNNMEKENSQEWTKEKINQDAPSNEEIISDYAMYAAGFGLIPIPLVDLVSISTVQYKMIKKIAGSYDHVTFDKNKTKSVIAAIMGGMGSLELGIILRFMFKSVPFFGPIIGGTAVSGFAYVSTKLIGQIFDEHFGSGGDLSVENLTLQKMKKAFKFEMKKASSKS